MQRIVNNSNRNARLSYTESYDLNNMYRNQKNIPPGLLLLFIVASSDELIFNAMLAEVDDEKGYAELKVRERYFDEYFSDIKTLVSVFTSSGMKKWEIDCVHNGTNITISGWIDETVVTVRYPIGLKIDPYHFFLDIERQTYEYHDYDSYLVKNIRNFFLKDQKEALQILDQMSMAPDILKEFSGCFTEGRFKFPTKKDAINIEGFTAEDIFCLGPSSSELYAYINLVKVKQDPEHAIERLTGAERVIFR